jgi:hypothetical protein
MRSMRVGFRCSLLLCLALLLLPPPASAAGAAEGPLPTVTFLEADTLALTKEQLNRFANAGVIPVAVHNTLDHPQIVTLTVVGLDRSADPALANLLVRDTDTQKVAGGHTVTLHLPLVPPLPEPAPGSYEATLIASGQSGGLARRPLTLTYPEGPAPEVTGNVLHPDHPIDITLHAVNYLPSLLSSLLGLGIFLAVSLALAAGLLRGKAARLPTLLLATAISIGVLCLAGAVADGPWDQPSLHAISSRPIALSPDVPAGNRGTAASEGGAIAQLVAEGSQLRPQNLSRAEKYSGKYNLSAESGEAEAAATIDVRDYWVYAALTLTLGLLVGFVLHRWFQQTRPKMKLRLRFGELRQSYDEDLAKLKARDRDRPYRDISIDARLQARGKEIESLLDADEVTPATEKLLALAAYVDRFFSLRDVLRNLDALTAGFAELPEVEGVLRLELSEAGGYQQARVLLAKPIDSAALDSDESSIEARLKEVERESTLIEKATIQLKRSLCHLLHVQALRPATRGNEKSELERIEKGLIDAGQQAFQADSQDALGKAAEADGRAYRELEELGRPIRDSSHASDIKKITPDFRLLTGVPLPSAEYEGWLSESVSLGAEPAPAAKILWKADAEANPGTEPVRLDDLVLFTISLPTDGPLAFSEVEVDFGDGRASVVALPPAPEPLQVAHPYRSAKGATVVVRAMPDRAELASATVSVLPKPPSTSPIDLKRRLDENERLVNAAAFLLAVGSGMFTLYFASPSWGQPMDYLGALVWGGATGEGVKFAAAIADRVWPVP